LTPAALIGHRFSILFSAKPQEPLGFAYRAGYLLANLCQSMTDSRIAERFHDRPV
jgi:hypothetical protein